MLLCMILRVFMIGPRRRSYITHPVQVRGRAIHCADGSASLIDSYHVMNGCNHVGRILRSGHGDRPRRNWGFPQGNRYLDAILYNEPCVLRTTSFQVPADRNRTGCGGASEPKCCRLKSESSCKKVKKYIRGSVETLTKVWNYTFPGWTRRLRWEEKEEAE